VVDTPDIGRKVLKANSKALHVEIFGPESGPVILFFHGLGGSLNFFRPIINMTGVDKSHRLVLFDLEGHGRSPLSSSGSSGLSIEGFAQDAKFLLDDMRVKTAHVVGHSMGGVSPIRDIHVVVDFVNFSSPSCSSLRRPSPPNILAW
jgi:pimeloyl-ACP methyl ester carboxylesterase